MTEEQRFRLAAKACGKDLMGWEWFDSAECFHRMADGLIYERWNPRDDDGDSRRLEVDCMMRVVVGKGLLMADSDTPETAAYEAVKSDRSAATRLAVLNCAVAIGLRCIYWGGDGMNPNDEQTLWVGATRYHLGRMTYAVGEFTDLLVAEWNNLHPATHLNIRNDVEDAFARNNLGDPCDRECWERVRKLWSKRCTSI